MLLVDLNYNFECDWFVELSDNKLSENKLSDNKLSDNNLASELGLTTKLVVFVGVVL